MAATINKFGDLWIATEALTSGNSTAQAAGTRVQALWLNVISNVAATSTIRLEDGNAVILLNTKAITATLPFTLRFPQGIQWSSDGLIFIGATYGAGATITYDLGFRLVR